MAYVHAPKENWAKIEEPYYDLVRVEKVLSSLEPNVNDFLQGISLTGIFFLCKMCY